MLALSLVSNQPAFGEALETAWQNLPAPTPDQELAWQQFQRERFPAPRQQEPWKFVELKRILSHPWQWYNQGGQPPSLSEQSISAVNFASVYGSDAVRLVMVDGLWLPESLQQPLPSGLSLTVGPIPLPPEEEDAATPDGFTALNAAFAHNGLTLTLAEGCVLEHPIEVVVAASEALQGHWVAPRLAWHGQANSQAQLVVHWLGEPSAHYLNNAAISIHLEEGAHLQWAQQVDHSPNGFHLLQASAQLAAFAQLKAVSLTFNGALVRNALAARLVGQQANCQLGGLTVLHGQTQAHQHVTLHHLAGHCTSQQVFKAIANDEAKSEFDGTIVVAKGAQKTDAQQLSKNLLLSPRAKAYARPWLRIDADDVKCSHGATVGQLDASELFYLQSRGIPLVQARQLLTYAFASDLLSQLDTLPPVRDFFRHRVLATLNPS